MSAETSVAVPGQTVSRRQQFRTWRGTRPFWAGLYVLLSGLPIMYFPYFHLKIGHLTMALGTPAGGSSLIIGVLLIVLGISIWFQKHVRVFAGVAAVLLGLVSIPLSNLGGFIMGFMLAMVGGSMAVAWSPGKQPQPADEAPTGVGFAPEAAPGTAPEVAFDKGTDGVNESNDLSGTSPANGANGRHSAG